MMGRLLQGLRVLAALSGVNCLARLPVFGEVVEKEPSIRSDAKLQATRGKNASQPLGGTSAVKWLTMFNPQLAADQQHSFMNLAQCYDLPRLQDAYRKYKMPGLLGLDAAGVWDVPSYPNDCYLAPHGSGCPSKPAPVKTGLTPHWRANLTKAMDAAEPYLRDGSLLGIFLGDELLCE